LAERIMPAANISEQISTAGMEASGTGNMKFAMNGALTVGTLDGANVEIREEVGEDNIYIFGLTVEQVEDLQHRQAYHPWEYYHRSPTIRQVMDSLISTRFSPGDPELFRPIYDKLLNHGDPYFHLADLESYIETKDRAVSDYRDQSTWNRKAILNVARSGKFSSDRTVKEYAEEIWGIAPQAG